MIKKEVARRAVEELENLYPDAICSLESTKPYELLIATRLSAQCTDARVNIVTKVLFDRFPTIESLAQAPLEEIEDIIKPCGLYKVKAKDIIAMCQKMIAEYHGQVPDSLDALLTLPGVGRKTGNLIMGDVYHKPAVVCDTHCIRINNRLGLIDTKDPHKAELALIKLLPPEKSSDFCHRLVLHGRAVCKARGPVCETCTLNSFCSYAKNNQN